MNAMTEYHALPTIADKLRFDPSGRPGAPAIRADRQRIEQRKMLLHIEIKRQLRPLIPGAVNASDFGRRQRPHSEYYAWHHDVRQRRINRFLADIDAEKADAAAGSPLRLFGIIPTRNILTAEPRKITPIGRGWHYRTTDDTEMSYPYSKAYHRLYGPTTTVTARHVDFRRIGPRSGTPQRIVVDLDSWRGDWLANAILKAGLAPTRHHAPKRIRLHDAYDARLLSNRHSYRIYRRTLLGEHKDYCIVAPDGTTYHHAAQAALLAGVHDKIRARHQKANPQIDYEECKRLGFCDTGIRAFCTDFDLDPDGTYTPSEIETAVRRHPERAAPYIAELRTLAAAVGHPLTD